MGQWSKGWPPKRGENSMLCKVYGVPNIKKVEVHSQEEWQRITDILSVSSVAANHPNFRIERFDPEEEEKPKNHQCIVSHHPAATIRHMNIKSK
jgi:hypothetical protein